MCATKKQSNPRINICGLNETNIKETSPNSEKIKAAIRSLLSISKFSLANKNAHIISVGINKGLVTNIKLALSVYENNSSADISIANKVK